MSDTQTPAVAVLSRFEANLQEILSFFLRKQSFEAVRDLLLDKHTEPACLHRVAVRLVEDALRKGTTKLLAKSSGWRRERHLRGGKVSAGRLWERTPPHELGLTFSRMTLDFLVWVTKEKCDRRDLWSHPEKPVEETWSSRKAKWTIGDQVFLYYAYGGLRALARDPWPATHKVFARHLLCRLAWPQDFTTVTDDDRPDFRPWTEGVGACVLESLASELTGRCVETERLKGMLGTWQTMQQIGRAQTQMLEALFDAAEAARRLDLARFVLAALPRILPDGTTAAEWLGSLTTRGNTMVERTETGRMALALLHQVPRLRRWAQQARGAAFFDEEYAASQLYLSDWAHWQGEALAKRAEAIVRETEPL